MNVRSVTAVDFRSYPLLDVEFPLGATAIVGENGAGKSSILTAIDYALYAGKGEGARLVRRGCVDMSVVVVVEHAGEVYSIARGVRKGKPWLQFGALGDGSGADLTLESVDATTRRIADVLGLSREAFRCSCALMQGDAAAFTEADPRDRKRVLAGALGLEAWDRLAVLVKRDRGAAEVELAQAERDRQNAAGLEAEIAQLDEAMPDLGELDAEVLTAEGVAAGARAALEAALGEQARASARAACRMGLETARLNRLRAEQAIAEQAADRQRLEAARLHAEGADELEAKLVAAREVAALRLERRRVVASGETLERELAAVGDRARQALVDGACPTCGQAIAGKAADAVIEAGNARARELERELGEAQRTAEALEARASRLEGGLTGESLDLLENELRTRRASAAVAHELEARVRPQAELEEALEEARVSVDAAVRQLAEAPEIDEDAPLEGDARRALDDAELELSLSRDMLAKVRDAHARLAGRREAAQERLSGLVGADERRAGALHRIDLLERLHAAYSRDGVPALIVEQRAVPALETHANLILEQWASPMRVELRTQRATQTGELREALDIVVHGSGGEGEYRDYSGGEKTRLNVALRVALAILLSSSRGADVRTLIVDEPEYLDPSGNDALAEILRGLAAERFDRVLLVSPKADLGDALDQSILVEKDESGESSIVAEEHA